jgi:hypothetical protein
MDTPLFKVICLAAVKVSVAEVELSAVVCRLEVIVISPFPELDPPDP